MNLNLIGRKKLFFEKEITELDKELNEIIKESSFLIIGGAGSIGQSVVKEIFKRSPKILHVVDISENNLVELVRDLRSSIGYIPGEFKTYALALGSVEFEMFLLNNSYDHVFNLSALKHVRSEKDPFTLLRMIRVNILNSINLIDLLQNRVKKFFSVSTDKASNPVNMMGASKKIMELFMMDKSNQCPLSSARFANVAFSDGSLLHGFTQRFKKQQPISAPDDIKRFFINSQESGELCLLSSIFGKNREIFFPKMNIEDHAMKFTEIAINFLEEEGYEPFLCESEEEARKRCKELIKKSKWPCYFFSSDTTGEKPYEEFYTENEKLDLNRFSNIGVVKNEYKKNSNLEIFLNELKKITNSTNISKKELVELFKFLLPQFEHIEKNKNLDDRM
mgnify:CR=1 FL=1|tara:strand:- start:1489 stop:2664 length:1176 start_codon:yes stop_codon:yes gene_type:complete